jgi:TRAP-type C4-dicarboxylate transport system substrate-binding protein
MNRRTAISLLGALSLFAAGPALADDTVVIKLATVAPNGSLWHNHLKTAAQKWKEMSGGKVELKIFAGGIMGNEGDMVRKLRIGAIQAAALSTIGLHEITPEPQALDIPLLTQTREEWEHLVKTMAPKLEQALAKERTNDKGFVVLAWSEIGFTRFFSTQPRPTLAELRQGKLFSWEGDEASTKAWKAGGFDPVVLASTDMMPSLQTGMINTVLYPPTLVLALNLYSKAKYMMNLPWSTLTGATIVDKRSWDKIPAELRPKLQEIFRDASREIVKDARNLEDKALAEMKGKGLEVVQVKDAGEWRKALEATYGEIRGKVVPAEIFDEVHRVVKEYRAGKR